MYAIYIHAREPKVRIHKDTCSHYLKRNPVGSNKGHWIEGSATLNYALARVEKMTTPLWDVATCKHCGGDLTIPILAKRGMTEQERMRLVQATVVKHHRHIRSCVTAEDVLKFCRERSWDLSTALYYLGNAFDKVEEPGSVDHGSCQNTEHRQVAQLMAYYCVPPEAFYEWDT